MEQSQKSRANVYGMVITALFTALTVVCAQISIPIGPVSINLALLAVFAAGGCLGPVKAVISQLVYLLAGLAGLPFFAGFQGGPGVLLGPTGGYIIGYAFAALITGLLAVRFHRRFWPCALGMLLSLAVCYAFGTAWYAISTHTGFVPALMVCVVPFIPGDLCKIALAAFLTARLKRIYSAHL